MQTANRKSSTFVSPHVTIQIPKEYLDGEMLQDISGALSSAVDRLQKSGASAKCTRTLKAIAESLERLEHVVNGNLALHDGEIVATEIPDFARDLQPHSRNVS